MRGKSGIWTSVYIRLMVFQLCTELGLALINPITSNFAVIMGASLSVAGFLAGLSALSSLFLRPLGGLVLGRGSRKGLLLAASLLFAVSSFLCVVVESVPLLGVSRFVNGVAFVVKSSLVIALVTAVVPRSLIGQGVGWIGLAYTVTNAIGPGIGSWLGLTFGYPAAFLASGIVFVLAFVVMLPIEDPADQKARIDEAGDKPSVRQRTGIRRFVHPPTIPLALITVCEAFLYGSIINLVLLVSEQREIGGASLFFLAYAVVSLVARPLSSKLYDEHGLRKVLFPEAAAMCLAPVVLAFAHDTSMVLLAGVLLALGQGCLYPCLQAESVKGVSDEESAIAVNTFYMGPDVGMAVGPIVSGVILQACGSTAMYLASFGVGVVFVVGYLAYDGWRRKEQACATPALSADAAESLR